MALVLCAMLVGGSIFPGFAVAGEADSEGEGTTPPIEIPVGPPDFDPGGEETGLEEEGPDSEGEEAGAELPESEVEIETPAPADVTATAPEVSVEPPPPSPASEPEPATAAAPEPEPQTATVPAEPIANQSIVAPKKEGNHSNASASVGSSEMPPAEEESPPPPSPPVTVPPSDPGRNLGGKDSYIVQPGDCLSYIAADLLPAGSDTRAIEDKVAELWRMNAARIGTDDPNLIYPGTVLRLR